MAPQSTARARSANVAFAITRALVDRTALAPDPGSRPAAVEIRRASAADAAHGMARAGRLFCRLARGCASSVPHDQATTLRRRVADRHSDRAGRTHVHRRQRIGQRRNRGHRAAATGTGAAEPARRWKARGRGCVAARLLARMDGSAAIAERFNRVGGQPAGFQGTVAPQRATATATGQQRLQLHVTGVAAGRRGFRSACRCRHHVAVRGGCWSCCSWAWQHRPSAGSTC